MSNWSWDMVIIPVEVSITLLGILILILHSVKIYILFIKGLINRFFIPLCRHSDFTNISVIKYFSFLLMQIYHIPFLIKGVIRFLFIRIFIWIPRRWFRGKEYCLHIINIFDFLVERLRVGKYDNIPSSHSGMRNSISSSVKIMEWLSWDTYSPH